ncbi:MAG: growth inhibitor PemK [Gammaproteobacteria bacterium]|nr:growth inhibitor PemK [Gammaproteobacteria bacterium]
MAFPEPEVGLVVSFSYLWSDEAAAGHVEGRKARPSAIVMAVRHDEEGPPQVAVVPITHSPHSDPAAAIEMPPRVAEHLGLDSDPCWVVLDELNVFSWPGYDLRQIPGQAGRYDYGFLPPRFFEALVRRITELRQAGRIEVTSRDDDA